MGLFGRVSWVQKLLLKVFRSSVASALQKSFQLKPLNVASKKHYSKWTLKPV